MTSVFEKDLPESLSNAIFSDASFLLDSYHVLKNAKRFENFVIALRTAFSNRLRKYQKQSKQRFDKEFPLLLVSVTLNNQNLAQALERLCCAIVLQEYDFSVPTRKELLQIMSMDELLRETCADERFRFKKALEALDRAKLQVEKLQKNVK